MARQSANQTYDTVALARTQNGLITINDVLNPAGVILVKGNTHTVKEILGKEEFALFVAVPEDTTTPDDGRYTYISNGVRMRRSNMLAPIAINVAVDTGVIPHQGDTGNLILSVPGARVGNSYTIAPVAGYDEATMDLIEIPKCVTADEIQFVIGNKTGADLPNVTTYWNVYETGVGST